MENRSGVGFDGVLVIDHYKALLWGILSLRFGKCNKKTGACLLHTAGITRLPVWSHSLEFDFQSYLPKQCKFFSENWYMYIMFTSLDMQMVEKSLIEILRYLINTRIYASYHKFMIQLDFLINQDLSPYWSVPKHSIINYQSFYEAKSALLWDMKMLWCCCACDLYDCDSMISYSLNMYGNKIASSALVNRLQSKHHKFWLYELSFFTWFQTTFVCTRLVTKYLL
mgnify:CR=1 FL=1